MSDSLKLLAECAARDIRLRASASGRLVIDAPRDTLTPDFVEKLRANKAELLSQIDADNVRRASHARSRSIRLCGNGFPPISPAIPPAGILADPVVCCPRCGQGRVLAELRGLTDGRCYECWSRSSEARR